MNFTWNNMQELVGAYLSGDNTLVKDEMTRIVLLEEALHMVASKADTLKLETGDEGKQVLRQGSGSSASEFVRMPDIPTDGNSIIDIDRLLVPAVARYMASFVSKEKMQWHEEKAEQVIALFNAKIYHYRDFTEEGE